ncbi:hypothetical protein NQ318_003101, partial [Aromia moschata]
MNRITIQFSLLQNNFLGKPQSAGDGSFIPHSSARTHTDLIRGGVNIFGKAVERVINTFGRIEDRLRALLEIFRKQLIKGVPELNIPVLDPLHINKIDFDVNHQSAQLRGNAEDVTIKHISKFIVDKERFTDLGNMLFQLDLNLTFPYIKVNGTYQINGTVGQTFKIYGAGPFWINLINLKLATTTILKFNLPARLRVDNINVAVKLNKLQNNFEHLMNDRDIGILFNKAISEMAPEALDILWPEIKPSIERQIKK